MPKVTYIAHDGTSNTIEVAADVTVMDAARHNDVPGIVGDCGGGCACATCHVYIDDAFLAKIPAASEIELGLLDCVTDRRENSRLSCQIHVTADLDGLTVHTPETQY